MNLLESVSFYTVTEYLFSVVGGRKTAFRRKENKRLIDWVWAVKDFWTARSVAFLRFASHSVGIALIRP